jgi:hypothetical protein
MTLRTRFGKIISFLANLIGCTSLQTIEAPPDKLHEQIRHEGVVKIGDKVRIVTEDQTFHQDSLCVSRWNGPVDTKPTRSWCRASKRDETINRT